ncbi:MAG: flagellar hook-associated protein 2 [Halomonas sp. HL-48]|nr:flagellar filament capping protein FliD [Halomonas sp. HL-48]KPQ23327.1 MAG: flagellar hook-associated protein 2 [Halomonas sp. HL-48]
MAGISSLGIGSGLDLNGLLDQLRSAERQRLEPITIQKKTEETKISAYGRLESALGRLQEATAALNDASLFEGLTNTRESDAFSVTSSASASAGRYDVDVQQLARAGSLATNSVNARDTALTDAGSQLTLTFSNDAQGNPVTQTIDLNENSTLEDIRDQVNAFDFGDGPGVTASIINDGSGYRLALASNETGEQASIQNISFSNITAGETLASDDTTRYAGRDALLSVNGINISSATNRIEEAIQGVTLDLTSLTDGPETIVLERDNEAIKTAVEEFVSTYNEFKSTTGRMTAFSGDPDSAGDLLGDRTLRTIDQRLRRDLTSPIEGEAFSQLYQLGITLDNRGRFELDEGVLNEAINNNMEGVAAFFSGETADTGFAGRLEASLEAMRASDGVVQNAINSSESRVDSLDERIRRTEESIERTVDRYRRQFGQLDKMVAEMNQINAYLFQQLSVMQTARN